jgi:MFS family permease
VLAGLLGGIALVSVLIARYGDRFGRRRSYRLLFVLMALAGTAFALTSWLPALLLAGLTGTVSTDVVESGPFTSLEQAMLPHTGANTTRLFGTYNTVATLAGSLGALIALAGSSPKWLLAYPVTAAAGLLVSAWLSPAVELGHELEAETQPTLHRSRGIVLRLCGLFALDSLGGGFVPQTFIAYLFTRKYGASPHTLALVFFAIGILQALSFQAAVRLAGKIGAAAHDGLHPPALEPAPGGGGLRTQPRTGDRAPTLPLRPFANGRAYPTGIRDGRRRPERAHRGRRLHEHRPLRHPAGRPADRRGNAPRRARSALLHRRCGKKPLRRRPVPRLP